MAVAALVFALAPAAQADTVVQTSSADLNLTGRTVLAAVNFYDANRFNEGHRTVGTIQGVDFDDFRTREDDTGSPIALSAGVAGATLSTVIDQSEGRAWYTNANGGPAALGFSGPDATEAENLANGGAYFQDSVGATLTFAFGASYADTAVEIQMMGGGVWGRTERRGKLVMSVGDSGPLGELVDNGIPNYELLTFNATTDASGGLAIDVVNDFHSLGNDDGNRQWTFLMGTIVTAGPSSFQPFAITEIDYDPVANTVTLTWRSRPNTSYIAQYSLDMTGWGADLGDGITSAIDENPDDGAHITVTFDLGDAQIEDEADVFFRLEED